MTLIIDSDFIERDHQIVIINYHVLFYSVSPNSCYNIFHTIFICISMIILLLHTLHLEATTFTLPLSERN